MKFSKSMLTISALAFLSFGCAPLSAEKADVTIKGFEGIKEGAANAETCKDKCTGAGTIESGSCSDLNVYMACKYACKPEYIVDCKKTAEKDKYFNLVENCKSGPLLPSDLEIQKK